MRWPKGLFWLLLAGCSASQAEAGGDSSSGTAGIPDGAGQGGDATVGIGGGQSNTGGAQSNTTAGGGKANGGGGSAGISARTGGGGTTGTAGGGETDGSAGSGGSPPPPNVAACPSDSGAANVGVWEDISPPVFLTPSTMETVIVVVNPVTESVFAAASNKTSGGSGSTGIHKSTDCGATWKLVSTGRGNSNVASGEEWAFRIDPNNPETMYVANGYGNNPTLYKTTNGGVDWDPLVPDVDNVLGGHSNFVQAVAIDPANSQHLAVSFHDSCTGKYNSLCLSATTNGGATWKEFNGPSEVSGWQEAATVTILGASAYLYTCATNGAWYTGDNGQSWTRALTQGLYGYYGEGGILGPDGSLYLGVTNTGIFFSRATQASPLGSSWTLLKNSPQASGLVTDGLTLFASYAWDTSGQPFYSAPLGDLSSWTHMKSPTVGRGASMVAYDAAHHIVYSANLGAGLWRLTTR